MPFKKNQGFYLATISPCQKMLKGRSVGKITLSLIAVGSHSQFCWFLSASSGDQTHSRHLTGDLSFIAWEKCMNHSLQ